VLGAFVNAQMMRELRWESFDDRHEMRRHLANAALMGFGGITADGCAIGRGYRGLVDGTIMAIGHDRDDAGRVPRNSDSG
jgi:hypothetical protein